MNEYDNLNLTMKIGIWIAPEHQKKGYGSEAGRLLRDFLFEEYPVNKLYAYVNAENTPSIKLLEKLGFKREGKLRKHIWNRDGNRFTDLYVYGLLRKEWERMRRGEK